MAPYDETFRRIEKKYRIGRCQRDTIEDVLVSHMTIDAYGLTRVTSLYFDTPERNLIMRSLERPLYKEKLRVRAYGRTAGHALVRAFFDSDVVAGASGGSDGSTLVFLEMKKKYKGIVYKRRVGMSLGAACAYWAGVPYAEACATYPLPRADLAAESLSPRSLQIAREIDAMRARCAPLVPSMAIACDREAWCSLEHCAAQLGDLRVTFDSALAFSDCGSAWRPVVGSSESIMELKNSGALPLWLVEGLTAAGAYPSSFSKYGRAAQLAAPPDRARSLRCAGGGASIFRRQGGKHAAKHFEERQSIC